MKRSIEVVTFGRFSTNSYGEPSTVISYEPEFYECTHCLNQFHTFDDAKRHDCEAMQEGVGQ